MNKNSFNVGDKIVHTLYGKGEVKEIIKNSIGEVGYRVYFPRYQSNVLVMNDDDMKLYDEEMAKFANDIFASLLGPALGAHIKDKDSAAKKADSSLPKEEAKKNACQDEKVEAVNHPSHYNVGQIEVIDYIESLGLGVGFNLGNAIKYISRAGYKRGNSTEQDIKKSLWYIGRQRKAWENEWSPFAPAKNKINCLRYIEDKQLSYCLASAIDFIDASLSAESQGLAIHTLKQAENSLNYWLKHYCNEEAK